MREFRRQDNVVVKSVFDELGASMAAVTIKHSKDLDFGPRLNAGLFALRLDDIQNNGNPVFIRLAHRSHVGISGETSNSAKRLGANLGGLELLQRRGLLGLGPLNQLLYLLLQDGVFNLLLLLFLRNNWLFHGAHDLQ